MKHLAIAAATAALAVPALAKTAPVDPAKAPAGAYVFISPAGEWKGKELRKDEKAAAFAAQVPNESYTAKAEIFATSLGAFELYVNGKLVSVKEYGNRADYLRPGATDPHKRRAVTGYDVSDLWKKGEGVTNTVSAFVARSWFNDSLGGRLDVKPALAVKIRLTSADGGEQIFTTGPEWTASFDTPFARAGIYYGESRDGRIPLDAAACAGETPAEINTSFKGETTPQEGPGVSLRRDLALSPVEAYSFRKEDVKGAGKDAFGHVTGKKMFVENGKVLRPLSVKPGETLLIDFGQNAAAIPRITASAPAGTTLAFKSAEILNDSNGEKSRGCDGPAGSIYRANLRGLAKDGAIVRYTFAGGKNETYEPMFTFMGYRYAEITADGPVSIKSIESVPVTSVALSAERGRLVTGREDVNKLVSNIRWGQYSNYVSIPTDCPQRDERMGWTADTQVFVPAAFRNSDSLAFLKKWMTDMRDAQDSRGRFPGVAPRQRWGGSSYGRLGWADAGVIVPWTVWRMSGDVSIINENWAAMCRFLDFQRSTKYTTAKSADGFYQWADWLSFEKYESNSGRYAEKKNGKRSVRPETLVYWDYMAACHRYRNTLLMAEMAQLTGRNEEAAKFKAESVAVRDEILKEYFKDAGRLPAFLRDMQTPHLFALNLGLYTNQAVKAEAIGELVKNIEGRGNRLATGFLGTAMIMDVLTREAKRPDLAYSLLLQHGHPSWLYSVDQGATTIWERWNSYTKEKGFGPVGMNSFNHYAYGAVLDWIYGTAAGLKPGAKGGFDGEFTLAPIPDRRLGSLFCTYKTKNGTITSSWKYEDGKCKWNFTVPQGSVATVTFAGKTAKYAGGSYYLEAKAE